MLRSASAQTKAEKGLFAWTRAGSQELELDYATSGRPSAVQSGSPAVLRPQPGLAGGIQPRWELQQLGPVPEDVAPYEVRVPARNILYTVWKFIKLPDLPSAARPMTSEIKFQLLEMLLSCQEEHPTFREQLSSVHEALLAHAKDSLQKVLDNPKVPPHAKEAAQQRVQASSTRAFTLLEHWCATTCSSRSFQAVAPVVRAALDALGPVPAWVVALDPLDANREGSRMEEAALQLLQQQLLPGWQLVTNGHLTAVEGVTVIHEPAVKAEVDMLLLDPTGLAVAVLEVKHAAANPLMTCAADVGGLMRLVELIRGKRVTLKVKLPEGGGTEAGGEAGASPLASTGGRATVPVTAAAVVAAELAGSGPAQSGLWGTHRLHHQQEGQQGFASVEDGDLKSRPSSPIDQLLDRCSPLASQSSDAFESDPHAGAVVAAAAMAAVAAPIVDAPFGVPKWAEVQVDVAADAVPAYLLGRSIGPAEWQRGLRAMAEVAALQVLCRTPESMATGAAAELTGPSEEGSPLSSSNSVDSEGSTSTSTSSKQKQGSSGRVVLRLTPQQRVGVQQQVEQQLQLLQCCFICSMAKPDASSNS